jgi:predicted peptidase
MTIRRPAIAVTTAIALTMTTAAAAGAQERVSGHPGSGIQGVAAITKVYTFGQKVAAVAIEYSDVVNPRMLDLGTFTVSDSEPFSSGGEFVVL